MAEDSLMDEDNSEERCSYWNQGHKMSGSKIFNMMGIVRQRKKGFHILATACLGLLCVILLAVIISHKSHNSSTGTSDGAFQRLTNDQYNKLTREKELLQTNYTDLKREKSELEKRNTILSNEKALLQASYDNLTREREELHGPRTKLESRLADGWIASRSSLYKIGSEIMTWQDSRESCQNMEADLAIVNDLDEAKFILSFKEVWIGLSDADNEGDWKWVDDTSLSIKYWFPGEPNDVGGEDCAVVSRRATKPEQSWNDVPCSSLYLYICEDSF